MQQLPQIPPESGVIRTARLELCPIGREDAETMFPVLSDPSLYEFTGESPPESIAALRKLYEARETRQSPDNKELWLNWAIRKTDSNESIGYTQATVARMQADVAWVIGSRWQMQGYGSEAAIAIIQWLCILGVTRIRATINPRHIASKRVAAKAGLRPTDQFSDGEEVWILEAL